MNFLLPKIPEFEVKFDRVGVNGINHTLPTNTSLHLSCNKDEEFNPHGTLSLSLLAL